MRESLERLLRALDLINEEYFANLVRNALAGPSEQITEFLVSNELWGGAGSIADQAGVSLDREMRRPIEATLIELGEEQIRNGITNIRTRGWVDAFRQWQRTGI